MTSVSPNWVQEIAHSREMDEGLQNIIIQLQVNTNAKFQYKLLVGPDLDLKRKFIIELHSSPIVGHSNIKGTFERINKFFCWAYLETGCHCFYERMWHTSTTKAWNCSFPRIATTPPHSKDTLDRHLYGFHRPYKQTSLTRSKHWKLTPKYYGSFLVEDRVGTVAYKLQGYKGIMQLSPAFWGYMGKLESTAQEVSSIPPLRKSALFQGERNVRNGVG